MPQWGIGLTDKGKTQLPLRGYSSGSIWLLFFEYGHGHANSPKSKIIIPISAEFPRDG
jgi:hypothetical protein